MRVSDPMMARLGNAIRTFVRRIIFGDDRYKHQLVLALDRGTLFGVPTFIGFLAVAWYFDSRLLADILFPLWKPIVALAGTGPNIGTVENPGYDWTPVHLVCLLAGLVVSGVQYVFGTAIMPWFLQSRRGRKG